MRKFFLFSIISFFLINSSTSAQNFFPLKVGNIYQIKYHWYWTGPGGSGDSGTEYKTITVIKDSVIDGESFYLLSTLGPFQDGYLFKYDSLNQKLLVKIPDDDSIRLAADFNAPEGSVYTSYFTGEPSGYTSGGITPEVFWGDTLLTYEMISDYSSYDVYNFTENIGFSFFSTVTGGGSMWYGTEYTTVSAILDSTIFNPLVLQIDSLYPVIDRPINTFPYLISIPFHASIPYLINHFQLTMEIQRDSGIVSNTNFNISISNPHIQINPPDLQPGDIIKMKVSLTDTSIFNNTDGYPDSGWATFRVLEPVSVKDKNPLNFKYKLEQNYPNPFNPVTIIRYEIPERTYVSLRVYDILGNEVANLVNKVMPAGNYNTEFNAEKLSSGVYICRLKTDGFSKSTKMILTK